MNSHVTLALLAILALAYAQNSLVAIDGGTPNIIYTFNNQNPAPITGKVTAAGLGNGESLLSLATLPSNAGDQIYGLSTLSKIYAVNPTTGVCTLFSQLTCNPPGSMTTNPTLSIDFNPNNGLLSILVAATGNFYTANITTGQCTQQTSVSFSNSSSVPNTAGLAYVFQGVGQSPFLYTLEDLTDSLNTLNPNTGGQLTPVGSGTNTGFFSGVGGFAVSYGTVVSGIAILFNNSLNTSAIYSVNLANGVATNTANLSITVNLFGIAVRNNPFPAGVVGINGNGTNGNGTNGNTNTNGGNTAVNTNTNVGNIVFSTGNVVGTATVPVPLTSTSYSTTANLAGGSTTQTADVTFLTPTGTASFSKTISDSGPGVTQSNIRLATVFVGGTNKVVEAFTEDLVANLNGPTLVVDATVQILGGQSTANAVATGLDANGNQVTQQATVLIGGVDKVTLPQVLVAGTGTTNVVVTVADNNGQTATQVATVNFDTARLAPFFGNNNSGSLAQFSFAMIFCLCAALLAL